MFSGNQDQFSVAAINDRLESLLKGKCTRIGTPLAAAVATALDVDRRNAPANVRNSIGYSDKQLLELAIDISATLDSPRATTTLPFGTVLETMGLGAISLDGEPWTLDAGRPGLHPVFTTRIDAHGPNLELLHRHITRLTQKDACCDLGLPQPRAIYDDGEQHLLHFAPCAEAGGVVLQCCLGQIHANRFCGAFPEQIEEFAEAIVEDMRSFWKCRKDIAEQGAEMRAIAQSCVPEQKAAVHAIILEMKFQFDDADLNFYVHYSGIDVALRLGLVREFIPGSWREQIRNGAHFEAPLIASKRYQDFEHFQREGANGRISELAAAVLASGRVDSEFIRSELLKAYDVAVEVQGAGKSIFVTFYWLEGTIFAKMFMQGTMSWSREKLEIYSVHAPDSKLVTMSGRPLSDLIDLPFGGNLIVARADKLGNGLRVCVTENTLLVDLASGRTWKE